MRLDWLGSELLSWRDLWVIVRHLPRNSALYRDRFPEDADWGLSEQLLALLFDVLQISNWQRAGSQGRAPEQLTRPGVKPAVKKRGGAPIPLDEMRTWLGWDENT